MPCIVEGDNDHTVCGLEPGEDAFYVTHTRESLNQCLRRGREGNVADL